MIAADGQGTQTVAGGVTAPAGFRAAGVVTPPAIVCVL